MVRSIEREWSPQWGATTIEIAGSEGSGAPVGHLTKSKATRASQPKQAMRPLQGSSAPTEVAEQGFDIPQTQRSQFPAGELAPFRLTSQPTRLLPLTAVGCSPLCHTPQRALIYKDRSFFVFGQCSDFCIFGFMIALYALICKARRHLTGTL